MTSLVAELNYSNMTAARGRRRMVIRNPDNTTTITHTTATAYTSNNGFNNSNSSNLNSKNSLNNGNQNTSNNQGSNSSLNNSTFNAKMPSTNIIYNLKSGEAGSLNTNEPSPSAMSASLALLNRIKSLETQKKRSNQLSSTAIKVAAAAANSAAISSSQLYGNIPNSSYRTPTHQHYTGYNHTHTLNVSDQQNELGNHSASQSPTSDRRSAKFNRQNSFSKSQDEQNKLRAISKSANPNAFKDKITDQKFFSRNFKLKSDSATSSQNNLAMAEQNHANIMRYLNDNNSSDSEINMNANKASNNTNSYGNYEKDLTQLNLSLANQSPSVSQTNMYLATGSSNLTALAGIGINQANTSHLNKLKLLKKRNALKKTLSNATNTNMLNHAISSSKSHERLDPLASSKEDLKSHNSFTNLVNTSNISTRSLARHLSRHSLQNADTSYNGGSSNYINNSQLYHKSSETVDELTFGEVKSKELRQSRLSFRAQSNKSLVNNVSNQLSQNQKAKSENEILSEITNSVNNINNTTNTTTNTNININTNSTANNYTSELPSIDVKNTVEAEKPNVTFSTENEQIQYTSIAHAKFEKQLTNSARGDLNTSHTSRENRAIIANTNYLTNRDRVKSVASNQHLSQYSKSGLLVKRDKSNESSKLSTTQNEKTDYQQSLARANANHQSDFRVMFPGSTPQATPPKPYVNDEPNLDYIDPNNIMSDPVIMEQFRKLYEEDEYFQQVHRKCCEWMVRYVIPEMEAQKAKGTLNHDNY